METAISIPATFPPERDESLRSRPSSLAVAVFVAMCLTGALVTSLVYMAEKRNRQARLDREVVEAAQLVGTRVEQHVAFLTATRAFLATHEGQPRRETFSNFVSGLSLRGDYAGLQGVGISRVLRSGDAEEIGKVIRQNYDLDRSVWPEQVDGIRTAITLLEPADARNLAAMGYDMATEERRREAMLRAIRTGEPAATAPLTLVQEITQVQQTGVLIYLPYTGSSGGIDAFVYSPLRMGDLFRAAMAGHLVPIEVQAFDADSAELPLYSTPDFDAAVEAGRPVGQTTLSVGGRTWVIQGAATAGFVASQRPHFVVLTAVAFALLAVAATMATQNQATAVQRARALATEIEARVTQKDFLLREMSHRIKNSIARTLAIVKQSSSSTATKEEFVESVTIRLRAMAAAQDLLIASGSQKADLAALLTSELQQLYGGRVQPNVMRGPPVSLDSQQTLALGLAVHELATNSLKYGAVASPEGRLQVTWRTETKDERHELVLEWDEHVPEGAPLRPALPPTGSGFGTKMIDTCVRSDLGGTIQRQMHAEGLTVEIRIPLA